MFLLDRGMLTNRFDPKFLRYLKTDNNFQYKTQRLGKLLRRSPEYGSGEAGLVRTEPEQVRYIRITDINSFGLLQLGLGATVANVDPRYLLRNNDLLIARSGNTVGKAYLHRTVDEPSPSIFAGYLIRFSLDEKKALPEYVFALTQLGFYKHWIDAVQRPSGQPNINAEEYRSWHLPVPPLLEQAKIATMVRKAYAQYRSQEQEAQALLNGLDAYLLEELGIELPPLKDDVTLFFKGWPELRLAQRWDPLFHEGNIFGHLAQGRYPAVYLNSLLRSCKNGFAAGRGDQDLLNQGVIQIRPTNMNERRELDFSRNVYVSEALIKAQPFDLLQPGEVLFNNTNSQELVGKTVYFNLPGPYFCSNHLTRLRLTDALHPEYLTYLFNAYQRRQVFYRLCVNWNNQSGINAEALRRIMLPLPPLATQTALVHELNKRKQQALRQSAQAQADFAAAKQEIENLLLTPSSIS